MPKANHYYFGRFNLLANYAKNEKKTFLLKGLMSHGTLSVRGSLWGFFKIEEFVDSELGEFITGYLAKYVASTDIDVAIPSEHDIGETEVKNAISAQSKFILHVESGLIVYHPVGSVIYRELFCTRFAKIFEEAHQGLMVDAQISAITDRFEIFKELKKFQAIGKLSFYLHPSNPDNNDLWDEYDERFKRMRVSSYIEKYEADISVPENPGLQLGDDEETTNKIHMAEDGYGVAEAEGVIDGKTVIRSTQSLPVMVRVRSSEDKTLTIMEEIRAKLKDVFARFLHQ